jgi:lysine 6-dehydrogenase
MKYLVLGAGMMGTAAAYDLAHAEPDAEVLVADLQLEQAMRVANRIGPPVQPLRLDVRNGAELRSALTGCRVAVSAVSYAVNMEVTRACLEAGVHMCDLGGNNDVVSAQLALNAEARKKGVTILPNCGLAPGLINILAVTGASKFDELESIQLRVGGLPQHPRPPLNYQIAFSVQGLLNEYLEPALIIRDGVRQEVPSLTEVEEITFPAPFGVLEAFHTSGGLSTLASHFEGKVGSLEYKTIRYLGHCEKFRTLLDLGFASSEPLAIGSVVRTQREVFESLLDRKLRYGDTDLILARATIRGTQQGVRKELVYEMIDLEDEKTGMTSMMRTTAFPTTVIALMLARGELDTRGVMPPEECVSGERMIEELKKRGVRITSTMRGM